MPTDTLPGFRMEKDAMGALPGASGPPLGRANPTLHHQFSIGTDRFRFTRPVIRAMGLLKKAAALANGELGELPADKVNLIIRACNEVIDGDLDAEFPLVVFQTGSGTQTNMNANEVIANRAIQLAGGTVGSKSPIHPNDDVNHSQSSNDTFPTAMHSAAVEQIEHRLLPAIAQLRATLHAKAQAYATVVMIGRTHLQDATPVTLGQVIGGWVAQLDGAVRSIRAETPGLLELAIGGTAVGTGLNAHPQFGDRTARHIAAETGFAFITAPDKFAALSAHDAMVTVSATLRTLAGALMKIANDVRWYACGPRAGFAELRIRKMNPAAPSCRARSTPPSPRR